MAPKKAAKKATKALAKKSTKQATKKQPAKKQPAKKSAVAKTAKKTSAGKSAKTPANKQPAKKSSKQPVAKKAVKQPAKKQSTKKSPVSAAGKSAKKAPAKESSKEIVKPVEQVAVATSVAAPTESLKVTETPKVETSKPSASDSSDSALSSIIVKLGGKEPETDDLHLACSKGSIANVKALVAKGSPVNAVNKHGSTPLHEALSQTYGKCAYENVALFLLENGANGSLTDSDGRTALHHMCKCQELSAPSHKVVEVLVAQGVPINALDRHGNTALNYAKRYSRNKDLEKFMKKHGAINIGKRTWPPWNRDGYEMYGAGTYDPDNDCYYEESEEDD